MGFELVAVDLSRVGVCGLHALMGTYLHEHGVLGKLVQICLRRQYVVDALKADICLTVMFVAIVARGKEVRGSERVGCAP